MLVCPQCQFENPNTNKFCQKCGTSLTHKVCPQCTTHVPFNLETCPNCGEETGTVRWAILSIEPKLSVVPQATSEASADSADKVAEIVSTTQTIQPSSDVSVVQTIPAEIIVEQEDITTVPLLDTPKVEVSPASVETTEDTLDLTSTASPVSPAVSVSSSDDQTQPLGVNEAIDLSPAEESSDDQQSVDSSIPETDKETKPPEQTYLDQQKRYQLLDSPPQNSGVTEVMVRVLDTQPFQQSLLEAVVDSATSESTTASEDTLSAKSIPGIVRAYLDLHNKFYPTVPAIHDAWQENETSVVLLEDRSELPLLIELWKNAQMPMLQILYWLDEMAKLWASLEPWQMRQSLLELSNLRVDEDQILCLQRLYAESEDTPITLHDLGQMWQGLFYQSQRTQFNSLDQLFRDLRGSKISTASEVRSRLEEIASEIESNQQQKISRQDLPTSADSSEGDDMPTIILPMQLLSLDDAGYTDIGRQREHNEDNFGIQTQVKKQETPLGRTVQARGLYILCDGMGGHAGGEVASLMAVDTLKRYFKANWQDHLPSEDSIREAIHLANKAIYDTNQQNARSGSGRMGTTLVLVLVEDTKVAIAHVGDSRLYRLSRKLGLEQVTVDHEVGQREIQRGVEPTLAYSRPDAYQLTQALGPRDEQFVRPDVQFIELNEDTLLILCSDGLSDNDLLETHWQTHLLPLLSSRANLDQGLMQLIDLANQHNGHDNITAVVIRAKVRPDLEHQQLF
ncbi:MULTISPECIES: serine/threonine phosphatase [Cyanophyceae]|uniref:serine/threonine phosphatase n=1 Tax=Cyanophyceae TaxID=3028117 RepID=UPI0016899628|nr:serine/threonine phosphatase [Trichocoleus sp. FACHB-69]MBD1932852.1 serine/threonine phosphatase [Trichocoleus sp. FACHB-69]